MSEANSNQNHYLLWKKTMSKYNEAPEEEEQFIHEDYDED